MEDLEEQVSNLLDQFVECHQFNGLVPMMSFIDDLKSSHIKDCCSFCSKSFHHRDISLDIKSQQVDNLSNEENSVNLDSKSFRSNRRKSVCVIQKLLYSSDSSNSDINSEDENDDSIDGHQKDICNDDDYNQNAANNDALYPNIEITNEDSCDDVGNDTDDSPIVIKRKKSYKVNSESSSDESNKDTYNSSRNEDDSKDKDNIEAEWSDSADYSGEVFNESTDGDSYSAESDDSYESDSFIVKDTSHSKTKSIKKSAKIYKTPKCPISEILQPISSTKAASGTPAYKRCFNKNRDGAAQKLFSLYNGTIFENELPDIGITWNKRMTKTAGFCYLTKSLGKRGARIELSDKVIDTAERIRDTLLHEVCHAAAWIFDGQKGHGLAWKRWANKAKKVHPNLPMISTCHNYEIHTKYRYQCNGCGKMFGRHSKSIDESRHRCASCGGIPMLIPSSNSTSTTPAQSAYNQFMKANFASIKKNNPTYSLGDVMKEIGEKFREFKLSSMKEEVSL